LPTSTYTHIPALVLYMQTVRPDSVLDVGVGNGKVGFLARDLLDVMLGERYRKEDRRVRIDGIEIFPDYIQEHQKSIYDHIFIGDAFEVIDTLDNYDLIVLGDVLEHFEKEKAWQFLDKCFLHCSRNIILNIPLGKGWTQPAIYGNPHETHRSWWETKEFEHLTTESALFEFPDLGYYGCFLLDKNDFIHHPVRTRADTLYTEGLRLEAITYFESALDRLPFNKKSEFQLVDLLLKINRIDEATERLKGVLTLCPDDGETKTYIAMLEDILKRNYPGNTHTGEALK